MVNLHFLQENDAWIRVLEIPLADIQRLCLRPLKWLRFVAFAIFGVEGNLYDAPGPGPVVDYDTVPLNDDASYYFVPDTMFYSVIDYQALNDRSSSISTPRLADFHARVAEHDGDQCVISLSSRCDAAHIILHAKGNAYIEFVITRRRSLYDWCPPNDIDIDMTENGMLMRKDIHDLFGSGMSGLLKTPNFALKPDDIPRVEPGEIPASRITLQHIQLDAGADTIPSYVIAQGDVRADWFSREDAPPSLILDFLYGVAVIKYWRSPDISNLLNARHEDFAHLLPMQSSTYEEDGDDGVDVDDPNDSDCRDELERPARRKGRRGMRCAESKDLCQAMDVVLELSGMLIRGYPLGTIAEVMVQEQQEEAEMHSREIARQKVEGWLERSPAVSDLNAMD